MKRLLLALIFILDGSTCLCAPSSSTSSDAIIITSTRASCSKDAKDPTLFAISYDDDVQIEAPFDTHITGSRLTLKVTDELLGMFDQDKKTQDQMPNLTDACKEIRLEDNITITSGPRHLTARCALIDPIAKTCIIDGGVRVEQEKVVEDDIPLVITGTSLYINAENQSATFEGSKSEPVTTTIDISGHPMLSELMGAIEPQKPDEKAST